MIIESGVSYEWIFINHVKTKYMVSSRGEIINTKTGKILKPNIYRGGYVRVDLPCNGKIKHKSIHRLVASAFLINYDNKPTVNHKNGNKSDNNVSNLEWSTMKEQIHHVHEYKLVKHKIGEESPTNVYTENEIRLVCMYLEKPNMTCKKISLLTGISIYVVKNIKSNNSWKHISSQYNIIRSDVKPIDKELKKKVMKLVLDGCDNRSIREKLSLENNLRTINLIKVIRRKVKDMSSTTIKS